MILTEPWWLLLLVPLLWLGWKLPRMGLTRPLRSMVLVVLLGTLVNPHCQKLREGLDLWVLVDHSDSASTRLAPLTQEWFDLLDRGRRSGNDRLRVIDFAATALSREAADFQTFTDERGETRVANAIETALAVRDPDVATRVLLLSDGFSTEPVEPVLEALLREDVPLDVRLLGEPSGNDLRLSRIQVPRRAGLGEPFVMEIEVSGKPDGPVPLQVRRDGTLIVDDTVEIRNGRGQARFVERLATAGARRYDVSILPLQDAEPGNNRDSRWIEVDGARGVLLLTSYQDDPLVPILRQLGSEVDVVQNLQDLHPGRLSGAGLVVLNNVPAHSIPTTFLEAIDFHVRHQGASLLMTGGRSSFGGGGYFESAIDPLLPVSLELRSDQRRGSVALGIVMDRSGSMSATVAGGKSKINLANEGAANAIDMLSDSDMVAVWAVDTSAHSMVPLQVVGPQRATIDNAVRRIDSLGGGIYVYEGLSNAWAALKDAPMPSRPIILFSDAADSVEPGDYKKLIDEITANGGIISVIALGTRADSDAKLLEDIARRGQGRIYFTDRAEDIPNLFSQEIVAVARSTFIEEPVGLTTTGGWRELADESPAWPSQIDSYNLNYRRDWATHAVLAEDEHASPLISFGRRGLGRVAAISAPIGGEGSATLRQWPGYGDMMQTLARWLLGEGVPPGMAVRATLDGSRLNVRFWHDERWREPLTSAPPELWLARGERAPKIGQVSWRRINPGEMRAEIDLSIGEMVRGVVQAGGQAIPFGPLVVGSNLEFDYDPRKLDELRDVSLRSGGRDLLDLGKAWEQPPVEAWTSLRPWLLVVLLGSMLVEALATRMSWWLTWREALAPAGLGSARMTPVAKPAQEPRRSKSGSDKGKDVIESEPAVQQPVATAEPSIRNKPAETKEADSRDQRRARFARAKGLGNSGKKRPD